MKLYPTNKLILLIILLTNVYSYYSLSEKSFKNGEASALLSQLRSMTSKGKPGSYNDLWNTYVKAFTKEDGYIKDYYSSLSRYTIKDRDKGSGSKEGEKFNREHSIPKSWWGGSTASGTQGADPFIVIPADKVADYKELLVNYYEDKPQGEEQIRDFLISQALLRL